MNDKLILVYVFVGLFPFLMVGLFLAIGSILGFVSGWYPLARRYPDQPDEPNLKLRFQSGSMGRARVGMTNVLALSVCPSGLRVGVWRLFGPFCRNFFVPWHEISVERTTIIVLRAVKLTFGDPMVGQLLLTPAVADRLADAAGERWPERTQTV
jgi:hypothetical protein